MLAKRLTNATLIVMCLEILEVRNNLQIKDIFSISRRGKKKKLLNEIKIETQMSHLSIIGKFLAFLRDF